MGVPSNISNRPFIQLLGYPKIHGNPLPRIIQDGDPQWCERWFINPMTTIVISTSIVKPLIRQLRYLGDPILIPFSSLSVIFLARLRARALACFDAWIGTRSTRSGTRSAVWVASALAERIGGGTVYTGWRICGCLALKRWGIHQQKGWDTGENNIG